MSSVPVEILSRFEMQNALVNCVGATALGQHISISPISRLAYMESMQHLP